MIALADTALGAPIDWVWVGDPGNTGELSGFGAGGYGPDRICGGVDYSYRISKYEVTNTQYTEFLNAVDPAGSNVYGLYHGSMGSTIYGGIEFDSLAPAGDKYRIMEGRGERAVNYVSFWDACRFANWMNNGGGSADTETGSYTLNGVLAPDNAGVVRNPDATIVVPSVDEWYKAAYYKGGGTSAGYWDFATQSDTAPVAELAPGGTNSANYDKVAFPSYGTTTNVGAYIDSPSAYGTFDQSGNVIEWVEEVRSTDYRVVMGGSFRGSDWTLMSNRRDVAGPTSEYAWNGFRLVLIPEPNALALVMGGMLICLRRPSRPRNRLRP
jgi:formylglycine-generating enzyme required for sulfatase activity